MDIGAARLDLDGGVPGFYVTDDPERCLRTDGTSSRVAFSVGSGPLAGSRVTIECVVLRAGDCP